MATELSHIELANKTHDSMMVLVGDFENHPEWITTTAFYKALHVVEAVFVHEDGFSCNDHTSRLNRLKQSKYDTLFRHYHPLWNASNVARYLFDKLAQDEYQSFQDFLTPRNVIDDMLKNRLNKIEQISITMLSDDGKKLLKKLHIPGLP